MTLSNIHPKIDACMTKVRKLVPLKIDKCITKPADCSKLAAVCIDGLLFLGGYGEFVDTETCQSKLLLTEKSFPISGIDCCGSRLLCQFTGFANALFQADVSP